MNPYIKLSVSSKTVTFWGINLLICVTLIGCSEIFAEPTPIPTETPTNTPTPEPTSTPTQTPSPTPSPTNTPTPAPLSAKEVFDLVSPSVAFVETDFATGSGILLQDGYVLTNAHVVFPLETVRVVFPNGTEFLDIPVAGTDLLSDLAILGPIETDLATFTLEDGEGLAIGSETFLIGYPGESEEFPQPTIGRGLISRIREWEQEDLTFFQTDANVAGGQSGGVMVSEMGQVIGITGFAFTEVNYGLVASAKDLSDRVDEIIENGYVQKLGDRSYDLTQTDDTFSEQLESSWHFDTYLIRQPTSADVELSLKSDPGVEMFLYSPFGSYIDTEIEYTDDPDEQKITFSPDYDGYYVLEVYSYVADPIKYSISSDIDFIKLEDADDQIELNSNSEQIFGNIDYPGDFDYYRLKLKAGSEVNIKVDSVLIDPYVSIEHSENFNIAYISDDDSGEGLFDLNSDLTYQAPEDGVYYLIVSDAIDQNIGGYSLTISKPTADSPTPVVPEIYESDPYEELNAADPVETEVGLLRTYYHPVERFLMQYPADWELLDTSSENEFSTFCLDNLVTDCIAGEEGVLIITIEELSFLGEMDLEAYAALVRTSLEDFFDITGQFNVTTEDGTQAILIQSSFGDDVLEASRIMFIRDELAYNATYLFLGEISDEEANIVDYTFDGIQVIPIEEENSE